MDYHSRINWLDELIEAGNLGNVERLGLFPGAPSAAWQFLVRDRDTKVLRLGDLHEDGTIIDQGRVFRKMAAAA